jgi:hypothetical protein
MPNSLADTLGGGGVVAFIGGGGVGVGGGGASTGALAVVVVAMWVGSLDRLAMSASFTSGGVLAGSESRICGISGGDVADLSADGVEAVALLLLALGVLVEALVLLLEAAVAPLLLPSWGCLLLLLLLLPISTLPPVANSSSSSLDEGSSTAFVALPKIRPNSITRNGGDNCIRSFTVVIVGVGGFDSGVGVFISAAGAMVRRAAVVVVVGGWESGGEWGAVSDDSEELEAAAPMLA